MVMMSPSYHELDNSVVFETDRALREDYKLVVNKYNPSDVS